VILPGHTRIDAAVYVPISEKWKVQANIENVLNRAYYLNADGNNNISPGSPRAVRVSLLTRFSGRRPQSSSGGKFPFAGPLITVPTPS